MYVWFFRVLFGSRGVVSRILSGLARPKGSRQEEHGGEEMKRKWFHDFHLKR
jgi:hypothetical protein